MFKKPCAQSMNHLSSLFDKINTVVFWVNSPDYKELFYVNRAYEKIWGRTQASLQNNLGSWGETLLPEDYAYNLAEFNRRSHSTHFKAAYYRVFRPDGELRYLRGIGHSFADASNKPQIMAGIDEVLSPEQWHDEFKKDATPILPPLYQEFLQIMAKEFLLSSSEHPAIAPLPNTLTINHQAIKLTPRERDCLEYLLVGKSAKETAQVLKLSFRTVETHLENLRIKTTCRTKIELIAKIARAYL